MFKKIRSFYGEKNLAGKSKILVRKKQTHNFNTAKNIGILFDAGDPADLVQIKEFIKYLSALQINCSALGYQDAEVVSTDLLFLGTINVFCQKDLDFLFRPIQADALKFMNQKFDMLIDLSLSQKFSLRYISSLSPAVFKVGRFEPENPSFDLMIDIHSNPTIGFLIDQIKNYVSILNIPQTNYSK